MSGASVRDIDQEAKIFKNKVENMIYFLGSLEEFNRAYAAIHGEHEAIPLKGNILYYNSKLLFREPDDRKLVFEQGVDGFVNYNPQVKVGTPIRPKGTF